MFNDLQYVALQDRTAREQDLAERVAERRNYARPAGQPSVRARMARRLFALAVATERTRRGGWSGRGWRRRGACKTGAPPGGEGFERRFDGEGSRTKRVEKSFKKRRGEVVRALDSVSLRSGGGGRRHPRAEREREEHARARPLHARHPRQGRGRGLRR
jgi:hypothetical protein